MKRNSYQVMPNRGRLAENCDLQIEVLMEKIVGFKDDEVYIYVVDTVKFHKGVNGGAIMSHVGGSTA